MARKRDPITDELPWLDRFGRHHGRLLLSTVIGVAVYVLLLALPVPRLSTRILAAWDVAVATYLVLALIVIRRFDLALVRRRAASQDEGGLLVLILTVASAVASLAAIFVELASIRGSDAPDTRLYLGCAVLTVLLSWTFVHVIFALHYAHEYYGEGRDRQRGGLEFPKDNRPDYWDFVYFSFVIGMTFQVSDVEVTSKPIRRMVVAHGAVSFIFNVAILALMVNIGSEFIK